MAGIDRIREEIILWNNTFPLDRLYRQKHNIIFNSDAHRKISQIDIFIDWLENELFVDYQAEIVDNYRKEKQYSEGIWLREQEVTDEDFDKIVI